MSNISIEWPHSTPFEFFPPFQYINQIKRWSEFIYFSYGFKGLYTSLCESAAKDNNHRTENEWIEQKDVRKPNGRFMKKVGLGF